MNLTQQVKAQAEGIALKLESRVKALHYDDLRAHAMQTGLNRYKPGLGAKVAHGAVILQRQGVQPIAVALHHSLVSAIGDIIWDKLAVSDALGECCGGLGKGVDVGAIIGAVAEGLEATMGVVTGINAITQANRDAAAARRSARSESEAYIQQQGAAPPPPPAATRYGPPPAPAAGISPLMVGAGVLGVGGIVTAIVLATRKG